MLTFEKFAGIDNVLPEHRLTGSDLLQATDVDIGMSGEITRRGGFTEASVLCHKNLWQAQGFMLATVGAQLTAIHPGGSRHTIHPALGTDRVWYCNLPDGRVTYSNGFIHGVTDGSVGTERSVPTPESLGAPDEAFGALPAGRYRYYLTYVRKSDRLEGPAISSEPIVIPDGGMRLDGLPVRDGYAINVYLSGQDGEGAYLAGTSMGHSFEYAGNSAALVLPCRTLGAQPFPVGTITAFWRGRVLTAKGSALWASRVLAPHLADWRDFKQMPAQITAIQPVEDGIYVGTAQDLLFLSGAAWDQLTFKATQRGPVVPGSGVAAPGHRLKLANGVGIGPAMLCIAGGKVVAGFSGGQTESLTEGRYRTTATEVCATFRELAGSPQYIAVPQ